MPKSKIIPVKEKLYAKYMETFNHCKRVARMSYILGVAYGLSEEEARELEVVAPFHDIGKVGLSEILLYKPDKLTAEEYEKIKMHTVIGFELLSISKKPIVQKAAIVSLQHHERWDGHGYPDRLKEYEIDLFARITSIIDVFDALKSSRVYKGAWEIHDTIEYIKDESGDMFEPKLVSLLEENLEAILNVYEIDKIENNQK